MLVDTSIMSVMDISRFIIHNVCHDFVLYVERYFRINTEYHEVTVKQDNF